MSASNAAAFDALAFQLAAALDRYDAEFAELMRRWPDMELYNGVSKRIDELRMVSASFPELSVQYVSLLIAHAELVHCLWKTQTEPATASGNLAVARDEHQMAIRSMRRKCLRLLAGSDTIRDASRQGS
ncbi:MAG: hypothetical protein EOO24_17840 [Comamonadaceae bacterium]|nr:MAG: hypothetical protein EOO24_17840 [Comamonadaceae bacterium]